MWIKPAVQNAFALFITPEVRRAMPEARPVHY